MKHVVSFDSATPGPAGLSRRSAVLRLGGGGLAALLASSGVSAAAQEASPMAGTPAGGQDFVAIRQYQLTPGHTMAELVAKVGSGLAPILREVPGFQEHFLVETSDGVLSISVFADQAGVEESSRQAAAWVQQNLAGFFSGPPAVTTGIIWRHDVSDATASTPAP